MRTRPNKISTWIVVAFICMAIALYFELSILAGSLGLMGTVNLFYVLPVYKDNYNSRQYDYKD